MMLGEVTANTVPGIVFWFRHPVCTDGDDVLEGYLKIISIQDGFVRFRDQNGNFIPSDDPRGYPIDYWNAEFAASVHAITDESGIGGI